MIGVELWSRNNGKWVQLKQIKHKYVNVALGGNSLFPMYVNLVSHAVLVFACVSQMSTARKSYLSFEDCNAITESEFTGHEGYAII